MTEDQRAYILYLNETCNCDSYGLLMFKGDPIAFEVGLNEWLREK